MGKIPLALSTGDLITQGLDGLAERLRIYKTQGARFANWREVYAIDKHAPTKHGIEANAEMLARYAAVCQVEGLVPIVEPEVLMDGDHDIDRHAEVTEAVQHAVFHALHQHHVALELMMLKPNMFLPGKDCRRAEPNEVARATLKVLHRTVPAAVPSINFLSGGQGPEEATANLNAINQQGLDSPLRLVFLMDVHCNKLLYRPGWARAKMCRPRSKHYSSVHSLIIWRCRVSTKQHWKRKHKGASNHCLDNFIYLSSRLHR